MILGMSISAFTLLHVLISLVGIAAGFVVVFGMFRSDKLDGWTAVFLIATILTSVTGYFFPAAQILPSHIVGAISLVALAIAVLAFYGFHVSGRWRWIYVVTAFTAQYLNVFVLVAQAFQKIPLLHSLAPTQGDPGFIVAQVIVLVVFIVLGIRAVRSFHPEAAAQSLRRV
jgi:hypothetical protein